MTWLSLLLLLLMDPVPMPQAPSGTSPAITLTPQDPKIRADEGFLLIEAKTTGKLVRWIVLGDTKVKYAVLDKSVVVSIPATGGTISVYAYTALGDEPSPPALTQITVEPLAPRPAPPAPPSPTPPTPPPTPPPWATGALNVIVVDDARQRTKFPYMAQILSSKPLRDSITKAGHHFVTLDVNDPAIDQFKLRPHVQAAGGAPALLIENSQGFVGVQVPCPQTPNDVVALVNKTLSEK
jgi:hypothetical protein